MMTGEPHFDRSRAARLGRTSYGDRPYLPAGLGLGYPSANRRPDPADTLEPPFSVGSKSRFRFIWRYRIGLTALLAGEAMGMTSWQWPVWPFAAARDDGESKCSGMGAANALLRFCLWNIRHWGRAF